MLIAAVFCVLAVCFTGMFVVPQVQKWHLLPVDFSVIGDELGKCKYDAEFTYVHK